MKGTETEGRLCGAGAIAVKSGFRASHFHVLPLDRQGPMAAQKSRRLWSLSGGKPHF